VGHIEAEQPSVIDEEGFTLIEIIAVLIIIGILAGIAVPKYMALVDEAKKQAAYAAIAEGMARTNLLIAKSILTSGGTIPDATSVVAKLNASYASAGDFAVSYAGTNAAAFSDAGTIAISASGTAGNVSLGEQVTASVLMPTR
jgi:prepilin-type N-terminal cleavage/methylation domain-containing protein